MMGKSKRALIALYLIAASSDSAQEVCKSCMLSDRGDRVEGVTVREPFSSGTFELLAVRYRALKTAIDGPTVHLTFWLDAPGEPEELKVWQPARNYVMKPAHEGMRAGLVDFAWPRADVIDRLGLSVNALYALVKADGVYVPALISTDGRTEPSGGYEFVFDRGAAIDADCTVERKDGDAWMVVQEFNCSDDDSGEIPIRWDGRDQSGRPAPDGLYALKIKGDLQTELIRTVDQTYTFRHRGQLEGGS